jgi:hypothetical protein
MWIAIRCVSRCWGCAGGGNKELQCNTLRFVQEVVGIRFSKNLQIQRVIIENIFILTIL